MSDLLAARLQMAFSLGFHIIFASIGIAMPFLMAASYWLFLKKKDSEYKILTQAWSKGVAIFFAVGAVSGTALSFELGLLWPKFMTYAGPIIGMPFSWEGTAFFLEAIAIGIFLYGWDRIPPWSHWLSGMVVGVSGVASAFFVICANGWMNSPAGFDWNNGNPINIDPWAAMFNDAAFIQGLHMVVGAFEAVGFAVGGIHAFLFLKTRHRIHQRALKIAFCFGAIAALIQPLVGDLSAKSVARRQPLKLAAMESHFETQKGAPLIIGGIPNLREKKVEYAIEIPAFLSFLAHGKFDAEVKGLNDFPQEQWPPVLVTHLAFQIMVGFGFFLAGVGAIGLIFQKKKPAWFTSSTMLWILVFCTPLGFFAIEAGWTVTEVGRQPWIIYGYLKTAEAVTPRPGIFYNFLVYLGLYGLLGFLVSLLLIRQISALHGELKIRGSSK
jgi:cytochrome d ubiquinol oxidase subunit I